MTRCSSAWLAFLGTRLVGLAVDVLVLAAAYWLAFLLRFEFQSPRWGWVAVAHSFGLVAVTHVGMLIACGCYRRPWRLLTLAVLPRYFLACWGACALLTLARLAMPLEALAAVRPPFSISLLMFFLSAMALVGWRLAWGWFKRGSIRDRDLLERGIRRMDAAAAVKFLSGKTVMITGAGGSIGSEIVRQVVMASPKLVLLVERGENQLYEIDRELRQLGTTVPFRSLMVDINDRVRMEDIFNFHRPEIVLHAAAYKHVPMVELNPEEGRRNNTEATRQLAELAAKYRVARFVMISTDKAVNPISVMGKTKLAAEQAILAMNDEASATSFCAVRFGNVFGSSGSVVPLFREQIAAHRPVTVTHPDMKRYFMTVQEAVGLVLQAASRSERAIYTLDMGKPVRIVDLAEDMIRQAGYRPYVDIPIVFTGIRPGEKLFEELDISEQSAYKTDMARIYITKLKGLAFLVALAVLAGCRLISGATQTDAEGFVYCDGRGPAPVATSDYYIIRCERASDVRFTDWDRKALPKWDLVEIRQLKDSVSKLEDGVLKSGIKQRYPGRNWMKWLDSGVRNVRVKFVGPEYALAADGAKTAPAGFVPLFNGRDLAGWRGVVRKGEATPAAEREALKHWHVRDRVMFFDGLPGGYNLAALKDYGDIEVIADWRLLRVYGDSGFYLRGLPQVQIWDPNLWNGMGSGGLWNNDREAFSPRECADRPIGDWNTMRMRIVGDVVSVWLNGRLVVDEVRLENSRESGGAVPPRGSFQLQCHGDPVEFRNLFVREL